MISSGSGVPDQVDLLITGGTIVDGTGAPGSTGDRGRRGWRRIRCSTPDAAAPATRRPDDRCDRQGRGARVHRPAQPRRAGDPRGWPARAEGPPGRDHRGRRRRRQRVRAVPPPRRSRGVRPSRRGARWAPRHRLRLDARSASYLERYDGRVSLNVATLIGNSPLRIAALGWDDVPADARAIDRMRGLIRDGMAEGAFGLSTGLDYPPGGYATTEELAALTEEAGRQRRLLPHPRPVPARRPLPGPVPRGDRDRAASRRARPHHPLLSPPDASRRSGADARARRRRARGGPRRHVRHATRPNGRRRGC